MFDEIFGEEESGTKKDDTSREEVLPEEIEVAAPNPGKGYGIAPRAATGQPMAKRPWNSNSQSQKKPWDSKKVWTT